jgi:ribonucleoside-diphosphate reductase alpha chain
VCVSRILPDMDDTRTSGIAHDIWQAKYRFQPLTGGGESSLAESLRRVAKAVAAAEVPALRETWEARFFDVMEDLAFIPAGRILAGAGTAREVTLFNCFVMGTIDDSITGIFDGLKEAALTLQQGGGIGHDFSTLRPKGAVVHSVGADASGPLSFMDCWDAMCRTIMSAGARRGAMMGTLRCDHPDIEAFVDAKRDKTRLRNFNVSVLVTDAFMRAVEDDQPWPLVFDGVVYKTVSARALWQKIMRATYDVAEPGVIFIDRVNGLNPLSYCEEISCTNPCGEQPLPPYGACLLGSLNLTRFVDHPFTEKAVLNEARLVDVARVAIRFLDDVIEVSNYPLPAQKAEALAKRRLGLGVTGLANALAMVGLRYGSEAAAAQTKVWMAAIQRAAIETSADLAEEKGVFPRFDAARYLSTEYAERLSEDLRVRIKSKGLRNGLLTSVAPTGTISLLAGNVSSGIEPVFALTQERRILERDGSHRTETLKDYGLAAADALGARGQTFVTMAALSPQDHLRMQQAAQAHVDSSISKTINVPENFPFEDFVSVYEEAWRMGLKGCTTFRPNAVTGSILTAAEVERCPSCGSDKLVAKEGCKSCSDCGVAFCG